MNTPALSNGRAGVAGMEELARHFVSQLTKQQAAELATRFITDFQAGDERGLAKANALLLIS